MRRNSVILAVTAVLIIVGSLLYTIINFLKKKKEEGFASIFITAGLQLTVTSFGSFYENLKEFMVLFKSQNVEESLKVHQTFSQVNWSQLVIGIVLILLGFYFFQYLKHRIYILNINGYLPPLSIEDHFSNLKLNKFEFKEREIDIIHERNYEMNEEKAKDILELIERKVKLFISESTGCTRGYTGIAPIPFVAMAGTWLKKTRIDKYFEFDKKNSETYYSLSKSRKYPELKKVTQYTQLNLDAEEVVITISTTTPITNPQLKQFNNCEIVKLTVDDPKDNTIKSQKQLKEYINKTIEVIEELPRIFPKLRKIHMVCSTQSCFVLEIGKNIEDFRNVPIIIYHFNAQKEIKYPWGIVINGSEKGKFIKA